jgi:hypothetical protein
VLLVSQSSFEEKGQVITAGILLFFALFISAVIRYTFASKTFTWSIWFKMLCVKRIIKHLARERSVKVKVTWIGAVRINPQYLAIWVKTDRDSERDRLRNDSTFKSDVFVALSDCHYPPEAIPNVGLEIESQQRVDRDCGGSWHMAMQ